MVSRRFVLWQLAAAGVAAVALGGVAAAQERGGTLRVVLYPEPQVLTSATNTSTYPGLVSTKIHEGLLKYDFDMNPQPSLAESWTISPDGKTYTFKLRQGVTWHDGKPFTSADVQFSIEKVWRVLHARGPTTFGTVTAVEAPDAHTIVLKLSVPSPFLMSSLSGYESQIVPKHVYDGSDFNRNPAVNAPIGTGPFVFKEWKKGEYISLVKNPNYWDKGKPYLDAIIYRIIPDAGARAAAFETGEGDIGFFNPVSLSDIDRLKALPHLGIETRGYSYFAAMYLMEVNLRDEYLKDVRVRQAMMHGLDRQFIVDNIWFGHGKPATGPVSSAVARFYTNDVPKYPFDVAKANQVLDDAGYKRGANNMRFKVVHNYAMLSENARTAEYFKQAMAKIGIDVELKAQDLGSFIRDVYTNYNFGVTNNFLYQLPDPTAGVQRTYWSANIKQGVPFANVTGYANPEVDRMLVAAQTENDAAKRKQQWQDVQRAVQRDLPVLNLFEMDFVTLYNKKVRGHTISADGPYQSYAEVWLAK
ncbi:MAG: ABC transporter substrate-binding protein [Proteobacteria bacterium]|nr:ABC transporter substrate-binding protein [Pseudomonadota bacterium]